MNWNNLIGTPQLDAILEASHTRPQMLFKHSTRCSISAMAKGRMERDWDLNDVDAWYLDLLSYRNVSNEIAKRFGIQHESPQAILLVNGMPVYDASHSAISVSGIKDALPDQ